MHSDTLTLADPAPLAITLIQPRKRFWDLDLKGLWEYRELLYFLVWRDIKVKYKQTALGVAWAILQPLLATLIFSIFFGRLARLPLGDHFKSGQQLSVQNRPTEVAVQD